MVLHPRLAIVLPLILLAAPADGDGAERDPALRGLDPVELCQGREVAGKTEIALDEGGFRYLFATEESRAAFRKAPARYEIQMGGGCARMGPLSGLGSPDRFAVHDGRVYVFASDACRKTFLASPERFLEPRDPEASGDEASAERARALLAKAVEAMGGAARVDGVTTYRERHEVERTSGGKTYDVGAEVLVAFPDSYRRDDWWNERVEEGTAPKPSSPWGFVVTAGDAFRSEPDGESALHRAQREALQQERLRRPLEILRARGRADFRAHAKGPSRVGDAEAETVAVSFAGTATTLCIDPASGRVLAIRHRGRPSSGAVGDVETRFADFREVRGLVLPFARSTSLDGKEIATAMVALDLVEVDVPIDAARFRRR